MSDNYLELDDDDFKILKNNFEKKNKQKIEKKERNKDVNDDFINDILEKGKKEITELNNNLKENIINDLKEKIKQLDSSETFNEDKINSFF